jgi:hypothetical protein
MDYATELRFDQRDAAKVSPDCPYCRGTCAVVVRGISTAEAVDACAWCAWVQRGDSA